MGSTILWIVFLVILHRPACLALKALVEAILDGFAVLEGRLAAAIRAQTTWLAPAGPTDPTRALVGLVLVVVATTVAYADYTVLLASLGLIWPTDAPPAWLAFSIVAVTGSVGLLTHSIDRLLPRIATTILVCALIGGQATIAYMRTVQLAEVRSIVDAAAPAIDEGTLVIGSGTIQSTDPTANKTALSTQPDRLGPILAAGIAVILCLAQVAAAWGAISFGGGVLTWAASLPVLLVLSIPWTALRILSSSDLRNGLRRALDALATVLESAALIPGQIAPFPWTDASLRRRLDRRRRVLLADLQERQDADAGQLRARLEQELRDAEVEGFREFNVEYTRRRRIFLRDLLQEAFDSSRKNFEHVPEQIVRMWFWPLDKAWHLMTMVGGEARFPAQKAQSKNLDTKKEVEI